MRASFYLFIAYRTQKFRPCTSLGNTEELVLIVKVLTSQPRGRKGRRAGPTTFGLPHLGEWTVGLCRQPSEAGSEGVSEDDLALRT